MADPPLNGSTESNVRYHAHALTDAVNAMLASRPRYMSPGEEQWWRRLLGNLEKAQHDNPHLSARRGEGTHNG